MFWFRILWTQNKDNYDIPYWKGRTDNVYYKKHVFFLFHFISIKLTKWVIHGQSVSSISSNLLYGK